MQSAVKTAIVAYFNQNPTLVTSSAALATALKIPRPGIVLAQLRKAGFLKSETGPRGPGEALVWSKA